MPAVGAPKRAPGPLRRLLRSSYAVLLAGVIAVVDYRLHSTVAAALAIVAVPVAGLLAAPLLRRISGGLRLANRSPAVRALLVAVPLVAAYLWRWRGEADPASAVLMIGLPAALSITLAWAAPRLRRVLAPLARIRNRLAPRVLRSLAAAALPVVITFWFVHGSLRDIGTLIGLEPTTSTDLTDASWRVVVGGGLAVVAVFLTLHEPDKRDARRPKRRPRPGASAVPGALALGACALALAGGLLALSLIHI